MDETISQCQFGREFLIKESTAEALLSELPNANGNVKIQSLYAS